MNSISESNASILSTFRINESDLQENKAGRLSEKQVRRLNNSRLFWKIFFTCIAVPVFCFFFYGLIRLWVDPSFEGGLTERVLVSGYFLAIILASALILFGIFRKIKSYKDHTVFCIEGVADYDTTSSATSHSVTVYLVIQKKEFRLNRSHLKAFYIGDKYRVYYIEPNEVVSAERIT